MSNKQTTVANKVSCSGVGLHTGKQVELSICPAKANTGIVFNRLDVAPAHAHVPAYYDAVTETKLGTTLTNQYGIKVSTVEHLMAALWGAGIDNVVIELSGPEVPIMDGSSEPFIFLLECAGIKQLSSPRLWLKILKTVEVKDGDSVARVSPNVEGDEGLLMDIEIEFEGTVIDRQASTYDFRETTFKQSVSRARTFGFEHEVTALRKMGLALGGSLDNAIVVGKEGVLNKEGLRYQDEFVRHKALDCVGDLYLAGLRIDGHFHFVRPGHGINNQLLRAVFADETAYRIVTLPAKAEPAYTTLPGAVPAYA